MLLEVHAPDHVHRMIPEACANPSAAQNEDVCVKTATFCRFMIPGLFPWSLVTILMKVWPMCTIDVVNCVNAILVSYIAHRNALVSLCHVSLLECSKASFVLNNSIEHAASHI